MLLDSSDTSGHSSVTSERDTKVLGHLFTAFVGFGIVMSQALVFCLIEERSVSNTTELVKKLKSL